MKEASGKKEEKKICQEKLQNKKIFNNIFKKVKIQSLSNLQLGSTVFPYSS